MKSTVDKVTRDELVSRISKLTVSSTPLWGKMSAYQMLRHCTMWEEMLLGYKVYKQSFIGRVFGKIALKSMMKDEPVKPNLPTVSSFKINGNGDVEAEKKKFIELIRAHDNIIHSGFVHPFFGKLTAEQSGFIAYKHTDHHLRQFGC